ncbi:hypothetical protein ACIP5Y_02205 [Nocardia sp. NPDC088792]|uniref:hypothetical protein n=1 Tax=Nocardia sp. NPDC088792 TaxID=3364332 RepID=UPI00380A8D82
MANLVYRKIGVEQGYVDIVDLVEYWREDVQRLSHLIKGARLDEIRNLACQCFVNTVRIAQEYHISFGPHYKAAVSSRTDSAGKDERLLSISAGLVAHTEELLAALGWYLHGSGEEPSHSIARSAVSIQSVLIELGEVLEFDFSTSLIEFISTESDNTHRRGPARISSLTTDQSLRLFHQIKNQSVCVFAKASTAWGITFSGTVENDLDEWVDRTTRALDYLSRVTQFESVDALLCMFPGNIGETLQILSETARLFLGGILNNDPGNEGRLDKVQERNWRFRISGMTYFIQVFAPCYDGNNTRFTFGSDKVFIQFISEAAFHRAVDRDRWQHPRNLIRESAALSGRPYDVHDREADTFVHNLRAKMPPVRWYEPR